MQDQSGQTQPISAEPVEAMMPPVAAEQPSITWTASETISQHRSGKWYLVVSLAVVAILALIGLLFFFKIMNMMTSITTAALVFVMYLALIFSSKLPARESVYVLSHDGIFVNNVLKPFSNFRSFGVRHNGNLWQLVLSPVNRFGMEMAIYIDEQHGEQIVDLIAHYLPMEEIPENPVDKMLNHLKF